MSSRTFVYRPTGCSRKPHDIAAYAAKLRCRKFCAVFFSGASCFRCMYVCCRSAGGKGPVILEHMNDAYAKPGASAAFECRVTGEPLPHITWYVQY